MAGNFLPPPTYADVILVDPQTNKGTFNPIWLNWFLQIAQILSTSGGSSGALQHNSLSGLQGGDTTNFFHFGSVLFSALSTLNTGTYTPTLTNVANLDSSAAHACQFLHLGGFAVVSGQADVDPTAAATITKLGISLPVASNLGALNQCCGVAFTTDVAGQGAAIVADSVNKRAQMQWISSDTSLRPMYFIFGYVVQ